MTRVRSLPAFVFSAVCLGCTTHVLTSQIETDADRFFNCDGTRVQELDDATFQANGCGHSAYYECHRWHEVCVNLTEAALQRASKEFSCARDSLRFKHVAPRVIQVRGCGGAATYRCEMENDAATCRLEAR